MKTKLSLLALIGTMVACGQVDPNAAAGLVPTPTATATPETVAAPEAARTMQRTAAAPAPVTLSQLSLAVRSALDLPACLPETQNQLVYAIETQEFFVCNNEVWEPISIAGKDGVDGQSIQGPAGRDGVAGAQGIQGVAGAKGDTGETGAQGIQGIAGVQGIQGIQGATGAAGQNGSDGLSAGIRVIASSTCATGGTTIQAFADSNKDGSWQAGEALLGTAQDICNGAVGATGVAGTNGTNGTNANSKITTQYRCAASLPISGFTGAATVDALMATMSVDFKFWRFANGDISMQGDMFWTWESLVNGGGTQTSNIILKDSDSRFPANSRTFSPTVFVPSASGTQVYTGVMNIYTGNVEGSFSITMDEVTGTIDVAINDADTSSRPSLEQGSWADVACTKTTY